jgi:hypothetical protein
MVTNASCRRPVPLNPLDQAASSVLCCPASAAFAPAQG